MMSVSVAGIPKNRCRTTVAERTVETRAELPFTGDQVGLFRARPGRPKRTCNRFATRTRYGNRGRSGGNAETFVPPRLWARARRTRVQRPNKDNKKDRCNNRKKDSQRDIGSAEEPHR